MARQKVTWNVNRLRGLHEAYDVLSSVLDTFSHLA
jgi:hypothetical protein